MLEDVFKGLDWVVGRDKCHARDQVGRVVDEDLLSDWGVTKNTNSLKKFDLFLYLLIDQLIVTNLVPSRLRCKLLRR